jgi:hypothetical protein
MILPIIFNKELKGNSFLDLRLYYVYILFTSSQNLSSVDLRKSVLIDIPVPPGFNTQMMRGRVGEPVKIKLYNRKCVNITIGCIILFRTINFSNVKPLQQSGVYTLEEFPQSKANKRKAGIETKKPLKKVTTS